jgi:hypothetical protein
MAHRQFIDETGAEWTVYDVVPRADDRRKHDRRQDDASTVNDGDDRRAEDRRVTLRSSRPVRLTRGWLCFEREEGERRRLQPIPDKWHHFPDTELVALLQEARPAPRRKQLDQSAGVGRR